VNQTSGTYTSKIFDANETGELGAEDSVAWNNLTWQGSEELIFEVRNCDSADCANVSFASADLNALNLSGQYFQYKVSFDSSISNETLVLESVAIDYSLLAYEPETLTITISQPSGQKDSSSNIPVQFSISGGENYTCTYNVLDSVDNSVIVANTSIGCTNETSFTLDGIGDGNYIFNLYVDSSIGLFYDDSSFSVSLEETEEEQEETEEISTVQIPVTPVAPAVELTAVDIPAVSLTSGGSQGITWSASNTGGSPLTACSVKPLGDYASWITSADVLNINAGEEGVFAFNVLVPADAVAGSYLLSVAVECAETAVSKDFSVEVSGVIEETGEGAPVGCGFAIFGEGGLGTGGIIILVVVILALGVILFFARKMRKEGKTLKDIFRFRRPQVS
jgi:hypothetical protein